MQQNQGAQKRLRGALGQPDHETSHLVLQRSVLLAKMAICAIANMITIPPTQKALASSDSPLAPQAAAFWPGTEGHEAAGRRNGSSRG
ncbi:hypothetical protein MESS4_310001 [Mesorhizobium sp. STM 4661]|nr:hypothetical protein MESS4_310001 [Mesorhizobium sp. STM 4661]